MKSWKKITIAAVILVVIAGTAGYFVHRRNKSIVTVQTGLVERTDLNSTVSASGEIKPKVFVNIGANAFGKITKLYVKEGDRVRAGQMLAQIENIQPAADVEANRASLEAARTDSAAQAAGLNTAKANLERAQSDLQRAKLDYQRAEGLFGAALIAKQDYDARKAAYDSAVAGVAQAQAQIAQYQAQKDSSDRRISLANANLTRARDVLQKTEYSAPFDGIVTNLPVREGETVVIGIQNAPGSTLMTLADMSVITAEVKVDETDIVNVRNGQAAEVTIDAIPKKVFHGVVSEIGDNAMVRSTGVSTSQSTSASQEAKDFKVVVTLMDSPANLRPGLSTTAKITTATKKNVLTIPIQALTIRQRGDLSTQSDKKDTVEAAAPPSVRAKNKEELQGIFLVRDKQAVFAQVETGITGVTDIEVTGGVKEGDQIITGSYKALRTIKNGAKIKIDNSAPKREESET